MQRMQKIIGLSLCFGLFACSTFKEDKTLNWSANQLFQTAKADLESGSYDSSIVNYTKLLSRYPFGALAQQATLDLAYAYFRNGNDEKALAEIDNFIRTYPENPFVDYAYYMRGVIAYEKDVSVFDRLNPSNLAQTDPQPLQQAFEYFSELIQRFPTSEYAEDAHYRMLFIRNLLGQHQLEIADYYLRQGAYIAAIDRANNVLTKYQQTPSTPYALALMTRAYQELGKKKLSQDTRRVLNLNFANKINDQEIQHYLTGDIQKKLSLWEIIRSKLKT